MRRSALFFTVTMLLLTGAASERAEANPSRIVSLNFCSDQLLMQLVPAERIASVTHLSRAPLGGLSASVKGIALNYGTAEELLRLDPDLAVAGTGSTPALRAILRQRGIPLIEVPNAESFAAIRANIRLLAHAAGEEAKAEALIAHMNDTLVHAPKIPATLRPRVVGWDGAGSVQAAGTLFDAVLTAAGGVNAAAEAHMFIIYGRYRAFDPERLLALRPDFIAYGSGRDLANDLASAELQHPAMRRFFAHRFIAYPDTPVICGLPQTADIAAQLARAFMRKAAP